MSLSMSISRRAQIEGVPAPTAPYSATVTYGDYIFVSGLCGVRESDGLPADGDEERVRLIFQHLGRVLEAHGRSPSDVLVSKVYVTDMVRHRPLINRAYEEFFGPTRPTRTILEVSGLSQDDTIEVEVIVSAR